MNRDRLAGVGIAFLVFVVVAYVTYMAIMLLGAVTGVIAMCATAPPWWSMTLLAMAVVLPVVTGFWAAFKAREWFLRSIERSS